MSTTARVDGPRARGVGPYACDNGWVFAALQMSETTMRSGQLFIAESATPATTTTNDAQFINVNAARRERERNHCGDNLCADRRHPYIKTLSFYFLCCYTSARRALGNPDAAGAVMFINANSVCVFIGRRECAYHNRVGEKERRKDLGVDELFENETGQKEKAKRVI